MRKLLCAMLVLALLAVPMFVVSVSAESAVDEDVILSDLIPDAVDSNFDAVDCEATINRDGSMTVTITGAAPILKIKLAEGTLVYTGASIDLSDTANNPVYVAVDFGTAGSIAINHMILHYTRKDKTAAGTFADLYLNSMSADDNYKEYRKQSSDPGYTAGTALANGGNYYVVWDWGTYVASSDAKLNDDKHHQFVDIELDLTGSTVGSQVTFYTIAAVSDPDVELGTVKPDPITPGGDDPSDDPSEDPSDDPSDEPSTEESTDEPEESSAVEESSTESKTEESSTATSAATSSGATSSTATSSTGTASEPAEEGGLGTGAIVGIIVAVVVVIGGVVAGVVIAKKKK